MLTSTFLAALLAITPALASPTASLEALSATPEDMYGDSIWVEARNVTMRMLKRTPDSETFCGSHTYSTQNQKDALQAGADKSSAGKQVRAKRPKGGKQKLYPEPFNNNEGIKFTGCSSDVKGGFIAWPILRDGKIFMANDKQGADRIVYKQSSKNDDVYDECGCVTHEGASTATSFVICTN